LAVTVFAPLILYVFLLIYSNGIGVSSKFIIQEGVNLLEGVSRIPARDGGN
jgi:hypothetical protein